MIRPALLTLTVALAGLAPASARADGLPVLGIEVGSDGVTVPSADVRYVTLYSGRQTLLARVTEEGGQVRGYRLLRGRFTIPAVAYDGSAGGLSADGRTIVLVRPRLTFPQRRTTFAVVRARRLLLRDTIRLRGDFSFDAISPDGRRLYLVQYLSPKDPTRYLVRLYDLRRGRLRREPVIDPGEVSDVMRGTPITRAASPDGRFAYTLYDGAGGHPFVHALDTSGVTARCIDLHGLMGSDLTNHRLDVGGGGGGETLTVLAGTTPVAVIDTRTSRVWDPNESATPIAQTLQRPREAAETRSAPPGFPWKSAAVSAFSVLFGAAVLAIALRGARRRTAVPVAERQAPAKTI